MAQSSLVCLLAFVACTYALPTFDIPKFGGSYLPWKLGSCLKNLDNADFKAEEFFTGHWYEYASFGNYLLQADGVCTSFESEIKGNDVNILYYQYEPLLKKYMNLRSTTSLKDIVGSTFKLEYDFFAGLANVKIPVTVVDTDYKDYAVVYSCQEAFGFKAEMSWIMTRARGDASAQETVKGVTKKAGLNYDEFILQKSTGCGANEPHL